MKKTYNKGFMAMLVLIIVAVGAAYFVKDEKGVSYAERGYKLARYYLVDRGEEAIEKAKGAQKLMQGHQDELGKMLQE